MRTILLVLVGLPSTGLGRRLHTTLGGIVQDGESRESQPIAGWSPPLQDLQHLKAPLITRHIIPSSQILGTFDFRKGASSMRMMADSMEGDLPREVEVLAGNVCSSPPGTLFLCSASDGPIAVDQTRVVVARRAASLVMQAAGAAEVRMTLPKPFGAVLEEVSTNSAAGVKVAGLQDGGSAAATGLLKVDDRLISINGQDVSTASFDTVMALLVAAPPEVELMVLRGSEGAIAGSQPTVSGKTTLTMNGEAADVGAGVVLRTAILDRKVELYKGLMTKAMQCGGVGQCATCWVDVLEGADNLSPKTDVELKKNKKKPETYRLACQAVVNGDVNVEIP